MDPPYYKNGGTLYLNHYQHQDHVNIAQALEEICHLNWIVTYDHVSEIENIYNGFRKGSFNLNYSLQEIRKAREIMILSDNILLPPNYILPTNNDKLDLAV